VVVFSEEEAGVAGVAVAGALADSLDKKDHLIVWLKLGDLSIRVKRNSFAN
jgi:hypothetical protein